MIKVIEAVWNEDLNLLQVVLDEGVVEHICPYAENEKHPMGAYAKSQLDKLLENKSKEYAELILNNEIGHYIQLCNNEAKTFSRCDNELLMYDN